jgi:site-specific DNA-methyltransferase (adenine-specific)
MKTIPEKISLSDVKIGERGRTIYNGIEELAESIENNGLIQPIVLDQDLNLVAGCRRFRALQSIGYPYLHHASTSDPKRPGFVLKGEDERSVLSNILTEIAENLARQDVRWQDQLNLLMKAYKLSSAEANQRGEEILKQDFAVMIGYDYQELKAALAIYEDVQEHPERYDNIPSIRGAYAELLKYNAAEVNKLAAAKSLATNPIIEAPGSVDNSVHEPASDAPAQNIRLTSAFRNMNGLEFLFALPAGSVDHIVTDPDYAVDVEVLSANSMSAASGVDHESIEHSLRELEQFLSAAHTALKPQGFCVFFYDLDHHEKLQRMAVSAGFRVQRWPLVWKKVDFRSNAAPQYNFCKNIEYAMVCRKLNATLIKPQMSSVYECGSNNVTKELGHPFAKPYDLWRWIYEAIAIKGQTVCDPFVGSGSSVIAAARYGLRPFGSEINEDWYNLLLLNLQREYRKLMGDNVTFS